MGKPSSAGTAIAIAETDKAILVELSHRTIWIPKSAVHDDSEVYEKGQEGELVLEEWWAEANAEKLG